MTLTSAQEPSTPSNHLTTSGSSGSPSTPYGFGKLVNQKSLPQQGARRVDGRPIVVKVGHGENERDFHIHETLITSSSKFFDAAMSGNWLESSERMVRLPEEDPSAFDVYFQYLYGRQVIFPLTEQEDETTSEIWPLAVLAWVLGDVLQDTDFKDAVVDYMIAKTKQSVRGYSYYPIKGVTTLIYENTVPKSPLRRLVVDQHSFHGQPEWLDVDDFDCGELHKEFLRDLSVSLLRLRNRPTVAVPDRAQSTCHYHEHSRDGGKCYKEK